VKIAITGHTAGIGQALAREFENKGHTIVGLSKRDGNNIRNIPRVADQIEPCDIFVNNAQTGYSQTELLFEMAQRWTGTGKHIVVISTMMTQYPVSSLPGLEMDQYRLQKIALEAAVQQLRYRHLDIGFTIIRPGDIATSPNKTVPPSADVNVWAKALVDIFDIAQLHNLVIPDISLGPQ
jgi:NADP-dependent 3-hydroxy acid dehydrogenase YdfG